VGDSGRRLSSGNELHRRNKKPEGGERRPRGGGKKNVAGRNRSGDIFAGEEGKEVFASGGVKEKKTGRYRRKSHCQMHKRSEGGGI